MLGFINLNGSISGVAIPKEYDFLEYITLPSGARLDTKLTPTVDIGIKMKYSTNKVSGGFYPFGAYGSGESSYFLSVCSTSDNKYRLGFGGLFETNVSAAIGDMIDFSINYLNNRKYIINNNESVITTNLTPVNSTIYIGAANQSNALPFTFDGNVYNVYISNKDNTIFKGKPAINNITNEVGLYDEISKQLITSFSSIKCIAGPKI